MVPHYHIVPTTAEQKINNQWCRRISYHLHHCLHQLQPINSLPTTTANDPTTTLNAAITTTAAATCLWCSHPHHQIIPLFHYYLLPTIRNIIPHLQIRRMINQTSHWLMMMLPPWMPTQQTLMEMNLKKVTTTPSLYLYRLRIFPIPNKDWSINCCCCLSLRITKIYMNDLLSELWCSCTERLLKIWLPFRIPAYPSQVPVG